MTKKLEDLLNLPDSKEIIKKEKAKESPAAVIAEQEQTFRDISEFDKIAAALPTVDGLGQMADIELNEIADKAMAAYDDLMSLGMNVESRYSGRVFEVAGNMLRTSMDAKVAKIDKKLKMVELQLKKQKIDQDSNGDNNGFTEGTGYVVTDRNSLIERLKGLNNDK
jgi:RNase P/RNase MRP subunit p29|tara:strand:+ start:2626 stop:3123 length:498 start_codon:yes stop_codon:yes gene_type:complete